MEKSLVILGSTGSIGKQALDVARLMDFRVSALTANVNIDILEEQIREFEPRLVAVFNEEKAQELKKRVGDISTEILSGERGVCKCAALENATVLNAIVGIAGLCPTVSAIKAKNNVALANKETLVTAGNLINKLAKEKGIKILPVDSEHSAVFQCLEGCQNPKKEIKKIILTASGGPFFGKKLSEIENASVKEALNHPNWEMGQKITIDSATMMNKGLELIEAAMLFGVGADDIKVVVHRQSIVHSLVEFVDNSVIAQLGVPDMRIPIQYALTYPNRFESPAPALDLTKCGTLTFDEPDYDTFKCIEYCRTALKRGGLYPCAVNAANEKANELFRQGKIQFGDIAKSVEYALNKELPTGEYTLEQVLEADVQIKKEIQEMWL